MATNSLDFLLNLRANTSGFDQGINGAKFAVNALVGAMATLGVGLGVKELAEAADSYANLSARVQMSTKETGNFTTAIAGVHQIALTTNSSLDSTAELFTKLNTVAKDMGMTQQQALDLTKTVTQAIKLGGGSVQGAEAAVQQFIQAMQGGVLRGEEFNSMMENGYGLAEALAKGLGVTTGELRKMAENGELGAERVLKALEGQKAAIEASYAELPNTIGNALQKIATSWQIVIGGMDQATGASATVASWLSMIADNLDIVEVLLNDIGDGFVWFGDQLKKIDPATIEALKTALLSAYDAIKSLGSVVGTAFETTIEVLNTVLGNIFNFSSGIDSAQDSTNGFTKALQAVNVVFGFLNDGFKAINIGINLIIGGAYDAAAAFSYWKSKITFGDTSAQAKKDFEELSKEAQKHYKKSADAAIEFKSSGVEAIRQISLTQDEKNAESIANNQKTLNDLLAQEKNHVTAYKTISDERIKLQQQLLEARKAGDQGAIDAALKGLADLDKKEKEYQAESQKITDEKVKAAQIWADAQVKAAGISSDALINGMQTGGIAIDENTKKIIVNKMATQGLAVEFDKTGKAIVKAIEEEGGAAFISLETRMGQARKAASTLGIDFDVAINKISDGFKAELSTIDTFAKNIEALGATGEQAVDLIYQSWQKWLSKAKSQAEIEFAKEKLNELAEQGIITGEQLAAGINLADAAAKDLNPTLNAAREAGKALGVDIDKTANIMSQGFGQGSYALDDLKQKLKEAGVTGQEASNTLYRGWEAWLAKADSQVELDAAKAKLKEYETQGVFSTKQVENGMLAVQLQTAKAAETTDEATQAFKRLGIQTKDNLALQAKQALSDFDVVRNSGQATQADLQKAYQKTIDLAYASGNAALISTANSKAASLGLQVQVDETGKASVKSMDELSNSVARVGDTARGSASQGFRELGRVAREEAQSTADEWEAAMKKIDAERKAQSASSAKGLGQAMDDMNAKVADYEKRLIAAGMNAGEARGKAKESKDAMYFAYQKALQSGSVIDYSAPLLKKMDDTLAYWEGKKSGSGGSSVSVPNIKAPSIESPKMPSASDINPPNPKTQVYRFEFDGKVIELNGDPSQQDLVSDFFNQLEQAKKRM
ncbi:tape measure protein [Acinetobacter higginsii]|uniref:tape measure protein n=1 Tax=Acinetobacter higginsii TaxID=70347 RepID=UPI001F608DCA|nr:tape measure protein [Acinetobacter higginsii]MCI3877700.1 tape measure protein [Acinetobacter higginsii]